VEYGVLRSRSEAIRGLVRLGIENLAQASDILKAVERLFEVEKNEGEMPNRPRPCHHRGDLAVALEELQ